jgi:hypothetical protein
MQKTIRMPFLGALAMIAGSTLAIDAYLVTAHAQTPGMERREDRRENRQNARDVKHECNEAGDQTRAECRQEKRDTKQEGRYGGYSDQNQPVTPNTNAPANPEPQPSSPPHSR